MKHFYTIEFNENDERIGISTKIEEELKPTDIIISEETANKIIDLNLIKKSDILGGHVNG